MYFKGMSGWNAAELEDIGWDVFGRSDDHIVPYQGIELLAETSVPGGAQKKLWHELKNDDGKNMCSTGFSANSVLSVEDTTYPQNGRPPILSGSQAHTFNVVVPTLHDIESTSSTIVLPSHDVRILDSCLNESISIAKRKLPFSRDPSLGITVSINKSKSCLSSFNGLSPDVTGLSSLENSKKARDNDLAYYDLPDISNFEDIDKMFRNWDSAFGQDHNGTTDELSWFSSSNTIYGSEIASDMGFQSPSLDLGALHAKLESHCASANFLPKNVPVAANHNSSTSSNFADLLDTDASLKAKYAGKEKSIDGLNHVGITQISNDSLNLSRASDVKVEIQQSSGDKRPKISPDLMLLGIDASAPQIYPPRKFSQEKHFGGYSSSSSYMPNLDHHIQMEFGLPAHQLPFTQIASSFETEQGTNHSSYNASDHVVNHPIQCPGQFFMPQSTADKEDVDKMYPRQQLCGRMTAEHSHHPGFQIKASVQPNLLNTRDDAELEDAGLLLPILERVQPTAQESSGMTSISSDNISEKVASFQQLQDILYQLDVRTKLCIRDSLYRLARSARQRHGFTLQNCSEGATYTKGISGASKRSAETMNAETNTNPIDRSIAHLLFHKPLATRSISR